MRRENFSRNLRAVVLKMFITILLKKIVPAQALEAWKKSPLHNAVILNSDVFKNSQWSAGGVAIEGKYAALWFSSVSENISPFDKTLQKGLGVSFKDAVKGLSGSMNINNVSSTVDSEKWIGTSQDNSVVLEIYGSKEEIAEGTMSIKIRLEKNKTVSSKNLALMQIFLKNLSPKWTEREKWLTDSIREILKKPEKSQTVEKGKLKIELGIDQNNFIFLTVKPSNKPSAIEIF